MFTLEQPSNPLDLLLANTGSSLVQNQLEKQREQRDSQHVLNALSQLSDETSPLDAFRIIESTKTSPERRKQMHEYAQKALAQKSKQQKVSEKERVDASKEQEEYDTIKGVFGDTAAKLWKTLPVGARTEAVKTMIDPLFRGKTKEDIEGYLTGVQKKHEMGESPGAVEREGFIYPEVRKPQDLRPRDLPGWRESRRKENLPEIKKSREKVNAAKKEKAYLDQLERLNESGTLPESWGRIIINPETGEPYRLAQLAGKVNAPTQLFLKTINDFTTKAKDSFGARVTNFDLERFMARLPGLLNTPDGRRAIISQMRIVNELDSLFEDALGKVFSHYGAGDITLEEAESIAENNIGPRVQQLDSELQQIVDDLTEAELASPQNVEQAQEGWPSAQENRGRIIEDEETGVRYKSDGINWIKV